MKLNTFLTLLALFALAPIVSSQSPTNGLVAFYKFNLDATKDRATVYDFTRNHNDGDMVNGVSYTSDRFGVGCSAMNFDGTGYITIPSSSSLKKPQKAFTAAVWFKLNKGADFFKQWITICCKSDKSYETDESPQYRMQATAQTVSINTEFTENFIPQLSYEVWYFYAYTFDGSAMRVFLNGNFVYEHDYYGELTPNNMPLEIGRDLPGGLEFFNGAMDDLRIYERALSETELGQIYLDMSEANDSDRCPGRVVAATPAKVTTPPKVTTPANTPDPTKDPANDPTKDPIVQAPVGTSAGKPSTTTKPTPPAKDSSLANVPPPDPNAGKPSKPSKPSKPPKDTTVAVIVPPIVPVAPKHDTILIPIDMYKDLPSKIGSVPVEYQKRVIVKSSEVTIYPYDNEKEDGDIVSINVNGVWVRDKYELKNKKPNPSERLLIKCSLNPGGNNYFISKAWNEGSIPPNTLTIEIDDGVSVQIEKINSKIGLSGGIRIISEQ